VLMAYEERIDATDLVKADLPTWERVFALHTEIQFCTLEKNLKMQASLIYQKG